MQREVAYQWWGQTVGLKSFDDAWISQGLAEWSAFALRELGVTHAPCIVQLVSSREELDVVASERVRERPDPYLRHPRPALLKDYFNPKLRKVVPVHRRLRQVTVKFEVDEVYVPTI